MRAGSVAVNENVRRPRATYTPPPLLVATGQRPLNGRDEKSVVEEWRQGINGGVGLSVGVLRRVAF